VPFVIAMSNDFQNDRLIASLAESDDRALGLYLVLDSYAPILDSIVDSTPEFRRDCRVHL
jgi:hypothetical protein